MIVNIFVLFVYLGCYSNVYNVKTCVFLLNRKSVVTWLTCVNTAKNLEIRLCTNLEHCACNIWHMWLKFVSDRRKIIALSIKFKIVNLNSLSWIFYSLRMCEMLKMLTISIFSIEGQRSSKSVCLANVKKNVMS